MKHRGFTLIELVIVIIVLGILAATAVPKFLNLKDDAEKAILKGFAGALKSGIDVISAKHKLDGSPALLKFQAPEYPSGGYPMRFDVEVSPGVQEILPYPISLADPFCEAIWNVAVEGMLASFRDPDAVVIVRSPEIPNRCDFHYEDIGSIFYMTGKGEVCAQYKDDIIPETCNI